MDQMIFSFAIRLQNKLKKLGIDEKTADSAIETLHVHCFRNKCYVLDFLWNIDNLIKVTNEMGIPLEKFELYIQKLKNERRQLYLEVQNI